MSRQAVYKWIGRYSKSGMQGLKIHKRGRPKGTQLEPWQSAQIVKIIRNYCPDELSMPFFLWTRDSISALIFEKFNIKLSRWTVGRYLAQWGFSPQNLHAVRLNRTQKLLSVGLSPNTQPSRRQLESKRLLSIGAMRWVYDLTTTWEGLMV